LAQRKTTFLRPTRGGKKKSFDKRDRTGKGDPRRKLSPEEYSKMRFFGRGGFKISGSSLSWGDGGKVVFKQQHTKGSKKESSGGTSRV